MGSRHQNLTRKRRLIQRHRLGWHRRTSDTSLLDPYPGETETSIYKIYVWALGKPGGSANITRAFVDEFGNTWYSLESVSLIRNKGQSRFSEKTLELTTIYVDITDDDVYNPEREYLFDNQLWSYFWDYDNSGLKLLQIRIYME